MSRLLAHVALTLPAMICAVAGMGLIPIVVTPAVAVQDTPPTQPAALVRAVADAIRNDPTLVGPIRGSLTLPTSGAQIAGMAALPGADGVAVTWRSSNRAVVSDGDAGTGENVIARGAVVRGRADTAVRLTATVTAPGARAVTVPFDLTVPVRGTAAVDPDAYLFVYFTGNSIEGEKIRFAVSDGNDALHWSNLNDAQPVLESTMGTLGLRDPFILRSAEGDRFFLIATDLSAGRTGWDGATQRGSHHLEIWESTDLVHWGTQRHVRVNLPNAGMTWAPEATYDPTIDAYVIYWTSTLFTDAARTRDSGHGPQILTSTTRDFRTFTTPTPWFKAADVPGLVQKEGMIDATVLKDGDQFYRFTKVSQAQGCASPDIIGQRSTSLRATTASGAWQVIDRCIGRNAGTPEVEGPSIFAANPGDVSGFRYYLWVDNYGGVGYIPLATNSLAGTIKWTYPTGFRLPESPRHGSVLSITGRERDALAAKWNRALLVTSVAPVMLTVRPGTGAVPLPSVVTATFADGRTGDVGVRWQAPDLSKLARSGGRAVVTGKLANSAATPAIATITAASGK